MKTRLTHKRPNVAHRMQTASGIVRGNRMPFDNCKALHVNNSACCLRALWHCMVSPGQLAYSGSCLLRSNQDAYCTAFCTRGRDGIHTDTACNYDRLGCVHVITPAPGPSHGIERYTRNLALRESVEYAYISHTVQFSSVASIIV